MKLQTIAKIITDLKSDENSIWPLPESMFLRSTRETLNHIRENEVTKLCRENQTLTAKSKSTRPAGKDKQLKWHLTQRKCKTASLMAPTSIPAPSRYPFQRIKKTLLPCRSKLDEELTMCTRSIRNE